MQWLIPPFPAMFNSLSEDENTAYRLELSATSQLPRKLNIDDSLPDETWQALFKEVLGEEEANKRKAQLDRMKSEMEMAGEEMPLRSTTIDFDYKASVTNRKVEDKKIVTTPAGEWECWAIGYDVVGPSTSITGLPKERQEVMSGTPVITRYIDYLSPEVGLVKREKMNFRGNKVEETMVLESVK